MLQDYQVGDGPLWVIHIVVGTPWFITQTDSAGCLLRCCRWGSKKHMKQKNNNKKRKLLHKLCRLVDMAVGMDTSGQRWGMRTSSESNGNVLRLFHHGKTAALPCLSHARPRRQTTTWCLRGGWTQLINMPDHAGFYGSMYSRSVIFMRVCGLGHAVTAIYSGFKSFRPQRLQLARNKDVCMHVLLNKDGVYTLVAYKIYFMQGLIFTYFIWMLFFCINVKYMHLPFPKETHIPYCVAFFFFHLNCMSI